ncbi:MAG: acyl-CoA dehydrogenase family protein [Saprospiraceae bacterium]|nr:acyl-CoA dehydrogenase family protein [Saprospiraceae bacterium]
MPPTFSPGVISMLPLFYVGWKDSILSPSEMKLIHERIKKLDHLTAEDVKYLIAHTNPAHPPKPEVYKEWLHAIKSQAAQLSHREKSGLAQLGAEMSLLLLPNASSSDAQDMIEAITSLEKAMGIDDPGIHQRLFNQLGWSQIADTDHDYLFDPAKLHDITNSYQLKIKKVTKNLLLDPLFNIDESLVDKDVLRDKTLERVQALAKQGFGALSYPIATGGRNDIGAYMAVFETLAYHDLSLSVKFGVQFGLFGGAILNLGTKYHHDTYLPKTGTGEYLGCFAMTETGHGSNVKDLETTATYDHTTGNIIVHSPTESSGKEYIGNALHAHFAAVFAQLIVDGTNHGIHTVLVQIRDAQNNLLPGIRVMDCGHKIGLNGVDNGRIWFDRVSVPKRNLLNRFGDIAQTGKYISPIENPNKRFFTMLGTLVGGRICVGLGALSAAKTALSIAINYATKRRQFSPKDGLPETVIMDYPTHQHRLIPKLVKNIIFHNALSFLAEEFASQPDESEIRKIETKAAGLKSLATWLSSETIQTCREACGGKGYLSENTFGRLRADADIFTTFEGDNTVLMQLVAKGLLTEFNQEFHEAGFTAVLRYIGGKIQFRLSEYNPLFTRNTSVEHLESDEFLSDALKYREKKVLIALADRMKSYIDKRMEPNEAFLKCQLHMIDAGRAYIERLAYRMMVRKLEELEESPEKSILTRIKNAFALSIIMENRDWYLENDYMDGSKTKAIRRVYNKHIASLSHDIKGLVTALGVNERVYWVRE